MYEYREGFRIRYSRTSRITVIGGSRALALGLYISGTTPMVPDLWETVWAYAVTLYILVLQRDRRRLKSPSGVHCMYFVHAPVAIALQYGVCVSSFSLLALSLSLSLNATS